MDPGNGGTYETTVKLVGGLIGGVLGIAIIVGMFYGVIFLHRYKDDCGGYSPLWWYTLNVYGYLFFGSTTFKAIAAMYTNATKSKALIAWEETRRANAGTNYVITATLVVLFTQKARMQNQLFPLSHH